MSSYLQAGNSQQTDSFDDFIDFNGGFDSNYAPEDNNTSFAGPSHEYNRFQQQTGLPTGSMSSVSAYNDMNMDGDFVPDFNSSYMGPSDTGYNSGANFSMDFETTPKANTYSNVDDFVDPSAVYEAPTPVRMWPGMHSQQAEQAKRVAAVKQQQAQHLHNQQIAQQQQHQQQQQQQHRQSQVSSAPFHGKARATSHPMVDPVAERKISDILDNMRHKSSISVIDEEDDDSHSARNRKQDDDEMDEDERLLASEEGKKLSSKERRQLRNKVSARAFRSRRKEYIGQLEGDLANKVNEANDLRLVNRKLLEENNQLKNLTRTVLSHPAFHNFLEDMSRNPTFVPPPAHMTAPIIPAPVETLPSNAPPQTEIKHEHIDQQPFQQQEDIRVNMAHVPNNSLDLSMLNLGSNHWGGQQNTGVNYSQPQVFAVFELPKGPSMHDLARALPVTCHQHSSPAKSSNLVSPSSSPRHLIATKRSTNVEACLAEINSLHITLDSRCS